VFADQGSPCTLELCAVALHIPEATRPAHGQPCGLMQQSLRLLARHYATPAASAMMKYVPQCAQHTPDLQANMPYYCPCITTAIVCNSFQ